ncbi:hypothetical protein KC340_g102 [Hortaea werneckii]|nr:hypothetical protein KC340_g102 [Hortaea werneckii]
MVKVFIARSQVQKMCSNSRKFGRIVAILQLNPRKSTRYPGHEECDILWCYCRKAKLFVAAIAADLSRGGGMRTWTNLCTVPDMVALTYEDAR